MDVKILDSDFRNNLYKGLVEAGYDKKEAQKIIGVKYHVALKEEAVNKLNTLISCVNEDAYADEPATTAHIAEFSATINELRKIKEIIS